MKGETIYGYTLQSPLGVGGMAEVWLAENKIGKKAAVKILLPKLCDDANVTSRFQTEAKVMVDLNHPNIRQVYDYGDLNGRPAIVMEYLEGADLRTKLKRGEHFSDEDLKRWWNQLASALNYTHKRGIVHRDIKPGNIFIDSENNVKLLDFGIAKVRDSISNTLTGMKLGTLLYMSPEQVKDSKNIDYHTDLYSLAVTFVHLITGKKPYNEETTSDFEISAQIVYKPMDLSHLPSFWCNWLTPYLNKDASDRPELREIPEKTAPRNVGINNDDDETTTFGEDTKPENSPKIRQPYRAPEQKSYAKPQTTTVSPKPEPENPKISKVQIYVLMALLVFLSVGVTLLVIHIQEKGKIARFTETYNEKSNECGIFINSMVKDKDGNEANKHFIIGALMGLKELEKMENSPSFKKSRMKPASVKMFSEYKSNLEKAIRIVNEKYKTQVNLGLEDNSYCIELKERLDLMNDILQQSKRGGNASAVNIFPKK